MSFGRMLAVLSLLSFPLMGYGQTAELPYKNNALPIAQRVNDLVSRMTLDEKVSQMQNHAVAIPPLSIPEYNWWNEALHGVASSGSATVFPQSIGLAATWDTHLMHQVSTTISTEGRAKYVAAQNQGNHGIFYGLTFWAPNINIFRDPRWGRGQETYGEDPFLTSRLTVAYVTGMQGDDPKYLKVVSTPKHFDVHSGPEPERQHFNVDVSPHDLEDTYLPAFRAAVVEAHAASVMCAYNAVNGVPACANKMLLQQTLRQAWHFQGYVVSDDGAIRDITVGHKFASDNEHASVDAVLAGTDLTCGSEYATLVKAVHDGLIQSSQIDTAVKRLMTARFRLGMFDPPSAVPYAQIRPNQNNTPAHRQLALQAARESIVLLKNKNGFLPLKSNMRTIAVIGPNANSLVALEGSYQGTPLQPITPLQGLRMYFRQQRRRVIDAQGSPYVREISIPVPPNAFHLNMTSPTEGLVTTYFSNKNLNGLGISGVSPNIDTDWQGASPVTKQISGKAFSVRWTGSFTPPAPGDYTFNVSFPECYPCDDSETYRVWFDGKMVAHQTDVRGGLFKTSPSFTIHFSKTRPHGFRMEYIHSAPLFGAGITLNWKPPIDVLRRQAVNIAKRADVIVAFVGLSPNLEGEEMPIHIPGFSGGDRTDIDLPQVQRQLLEALATTGKPLVVVLMNGSALAVNWAQQHAAAILDAWYPGEEGGTAIAETLAGKNNPAGRLPVTFYTSLGQLPPFEDYSMANRTYRYFHGTPLYSFGYGLSYSSFAYSDLTLFSRNVQAGDSLAVEVNVRNTSQVDGDEVVELYLIPPQSGVAPIRALEGFQRVHITAGTVQHVTFHLTPRQLSQVTAAGEHVILPGNYNVYVGGSQPEPGSNGVTAQFAISGTEPLPR